MAAIFKQLQQRASKKRPWKKPTSLAKLNNLGTKLGKITVISNRPIKQAARLIPS